MNPELLIDVINIIIEKSQSSVEQVIRKDKPIHQRLKFVSLHLNEMKSQIFQWISNILSTNLDPKVLIRKVNQLKQSTDEELAKNRLHILLKKKLKKLKKQSFMHSVDSHDNYLIEESRIQQLEKSLLGIQKDLNIEPEQEDNLAISSIIQKNRLLNFDNSAVRDQHNVSVMSVIQTFDLNFSEKTQKKEVHEVKTKIQSSKFEIHGLLSNSGISQIFTKQRTQSEERKYMKQNEEKNIPEQSVAQIGQMEEHELLKDKIAQGSKVMKKKKKSIYSMMGQSGNISKDDLLGNILQECLQSQNN